MDILSHLNWLAVIVAGLAFFALGALWYSKLLFVSSWIRLTKVRMDDPNAKKGLAQLMLASLVLMLVTATGIAILQGMLGITNISAGVKLGLLVGICFSTTAISVSYLYEKRPLGLHFINAGYNIVGCVIASAILSVWH